MEKTYKKHSNRKSILFVGLLILVFAGIYHQSLNPIINKTNQCVLSQKTCQFGQDKIDLSIQFRQQPSIEEEILIDFTTSDDVNITKIWVEGLNMFMGKTPVLFDDEFVTERARDTKNTALAVLFLGSCTLSKMEWVMYIEVEQKNTDIPQQYSVFFSTQR